MNWIKFFCFAFSAFFSLAANALVDPNTKKIELNRISGQIQQLEKTLKQDQQQQTDAEQSLKMTEITISQFSEQLSKINTSLAAEQSQLAQLKTTQALSEKKLTLQRSALAKHLTAAYELGSPQTFKVLANQENPNTLTRHLTYYRYLSEARLTLIKDIQTSLVELKENMHIIQEHQLNLKKLLIQKAEQQNQQIDLKEKRQRLITQLNQSVQDKQQQLNQLIANQKALQQLIAQLQTQVSDGLIGRPFAGLQHKLQWPVKGALVATFGSSMDVGEQRLNGVIIKAPEGTPVRAISSGKVIFANWLRGFGLLVIINHGNNYMSLYGRNHTLSTRTGQQVNPGDVIATTGSSGGFDQTGLYFEIRQNGTPVNPGLWCR